VEAEEAVEVEHFVLRDGDGRAHGVVVGLAPGDDDVEAVGCSSLKDDDEASAFTGEWREGVGGCGHDGAGQEGGESGCAGEGECAVAEEESSGGIHVSLLNLSALKLGGAEKQAG